MQTLLLDLTLWDLVVDANGNLAIATDPYSLAQDVSTACRTFLGDCWYNTALGIPYFEQILGKLPALSLLRQLLINAALSVQIPTTGGPGPVLNPAVFFTGESNRLITGQVQFNDANGNSLIATF